MEARNKSSYSGSTERLTEIKAKGNYDSARTSRPTRPLHSTEASRSERKRRTHSPASVLTPCRKSEDPPVSVMPLSVTPMLALPLSGRRYTTEFSTPECFSIVAFESPTLQSKQKCGSSGDILKTCLEDCSGIVVAVRVRPFTTRELNEADVRCVVSMEGNETVVTVGKGDVYRFTYDYSFWSFDPASSNFADQTQVYETLAQPLLDKVFEGYNTCLFAYGQTGSGKSYSVMGHGTDIGIIPRFCEDLFKRIDSNTDPNVRLNVELSFFEIYNEKIHDLLTSSAARDKSSKKINLKVREHPVIGPYVEGLSSYVVKSFEDVNTWITVGNRRRATAATGINDNSSRSHSVFTLLLTQTEGEALEHNVTSRINLIDLAGSERQSQAKTTGDRLREGASINRSLMTLGKVISNLSENSLQLNKKKKLYIPYRESVLTWLLKESLGGNSKTAMLATISPSSTQVEETLSALRYARQARYIINTARVNEASNGKLIRDLRAEIEELKARAGMTNEDGYKASLEEINILKEQLSRKEREMAELTRSWQERLQKSEQRKMEEAELLEKSGITLKLDNKLPNLVNLNEDPQLSEVLLYVLREGTTRVGRARDDCSHEILLNGPLIEDDHCVIESRDSVVTVTPVGSAVTYINGIAITKAAVLHHGDRVVFGGNHYFRFSHPVEHLKDQTPDGSVVTSNCHLKDFEFARQELTVKQNLRLETELEETRLRHEEEVKRLEQLNTEAKVSMEERLAKTQESARTAIDRYEDRLAELTRLIDELQKEKIELVHDRLDAKDCIQTLEAEKEELRHKLSVMNAELRLEQKPGEEVPSSPYESSLIEMLGAMVRREKENLAKAEQRRPRLKAMEDNLHRILLMLREANKISEFLKKDTKFVHEVKYDECQDQVLIKVIQTRLNVCTFWTLEKFEQKLSDMKDLYQNADQFDSGNADDVFFDPSDNWESESRLAATRCLSENMKKGLRRQSSIAMATADLDLSLGSLDLSLSSFEGGSPDSARALSVNSGSCATKSSQFVSDVCQQMLKSSMDWFKGVSNETIADKYLHLCQSVLTAVSGLENSFGASSKETNFLRLLSNQEICLRLTSDFDSLSKIASVWLSSVSNIESDAVSELCNAVTASVMSLGSQLQLFLQGLGNGVSELVKETSVGASDHVYRLSQLCGQLTLATRMSIMSLANTMGQESSPFVLGTEVKVHFVNGCDELVDRVLFAAVEKLEDFEIETIDISEEYKPTPDRRKDVDHLLKQMLITVSTVTVLLRKLQSVQVELDASLVEERRKSPTDFTSDNYYYYGYRHCVQVVSNIDGIVGGVSEMIRAMRGLLEGEDEESNARAITLSAELVSIASSAVTAPSSDVDVLSTSFYADLFGHSSILSDSQIDILELAADEVKQSTNKLRHLSERMALSRAADVVKL